ncbi:sulfotransferase domain-containing protein [Alphaproteobacteria bacterium]|nr:hypothetical protein [Alphaproteobacteria bacterium]MDA9816246.1 sulfotransferase domain-containing protein [Alphaproteobacteria bacterium]MDC0461932.1 sulfotransferase domain-containing protein [Alphaproteobacteria bacterium]
MTSKLGYIASYPKSGNTWLRLILSNYFFGSSEPILPNTLKEYIGADTTENFYNQYAKKTNIKFNAVINDYRLRNAALRDYLSKNPNTFLKTHAAFHYRDNIPYFDPGITGIFIYLIRDPRDILISSAHHNLGSPIFEKNKIGANGLVGAQELEFIFNSMSNIKQALTMPSGIQTHLGAWDDHVNSFKQVSNRLHIIKYEELVSNTNQCVTSLIKRITGKYDQQRIALAIKNSDFSKLSEYEKNNGFNENLSKHAHFFREGKAGAWKNYSDRTVFSKIEDRFGVTMKEHGYL